MKLGKFTRRQDITPSTAYKFFIPGAQAAGSGAPLDQSGKGNDASLQANLSDANCWATAGYFSSIAGTTSGVSVAAGTFDWDMSAGESLIFSVCVNAAALGGTDGILGCYPTSADNGIRALGYATGALQFALIDDTDTEISLTGMTALDSTDHVVTLMVDGSTKIAFSYLDGVLDNQADVSTLTGSTVSSRIFVFGSDSNTGAAQTEAASWRDAHYIVLSGGLPANQAQIAKLLATRAYIPLSVSEVGV